jgi:hypothetical protein
MVSSLQRKSITDLSRRRSRTFFAIATLALAVMGIGLFATPTLMNRAMSAEVAADRLPDLTISTRPLVLDQAQLAALAAVPNVRAVQPRSSFGGRVYVGARRAFAQVLGIPDFTRQTVNVVRVASGVPPQTGAVLTDAQNARQGLLSVQAGQTVRIIGADGAVRSLQVSGQGRNLDGGPVGPGSRGDDRCQRGWGGAGLGGPRRLPRGPGVTAAQLPPAGPADQWRWLG